jgi:hypothetical protein
MNPSKNLRIAKSSLSHRVVATTAIELAGKATHDYVDASKLFDFPFLKAYDMVCQAIRLLPFATI